jgi:hypothetical protein
LSDDVVVQEEKIEVLGDNEILLFTVDIGLMFPGIEHFEDKVYDKALKGIINLFSILDSFT